MERIILKDNKTYTIHGNTFYLLRFLYQRSKKKRENLQLLNNSFNSPQPKGTLHYLRTWVQEKVLGHLSLLSMHLISGQCLHGNRGTTGMN